MTGPSLKARAYQYLSRREMTRAELARKLSPHADSAEALEALLDELERLVSFGERPIDAMRRVGWANWKSVNVAYRRARDTIPPWCKNGHPRLDRTDLAFCTDCLATHYEKKAAS